MLPDLLAVGAGGFCGASLRYLVGLIPALQRGAFPLHTLLINLGGALLIGFLAGSVQHGGALSPRLLLFLKVGLCGGFTTFSTFSNEALHLLRSGMHWQFACYVCGSVALGLAGVFAGLWAGGKILQA